MKATVLCFLPITVAVALATFTKNDNCVRTCGNMSVPFPFGLEKSCVWNSNLVLNCTADTMGIWKLILGTNVPVYNISVENGTMTTGMYVAVDCYDANGVRYGSNPDLSITLGEGGHYTLSDTRNKLTVLGYDTMARISDAEGSFGSGCFSYCRDDNIDFVAERVCFGLGCCQKSIPKSLRSLNISMNSTTNYTSVDFTFCGSAFIMDEESFKVSDYKLHVPDDIREYNFSRTVLDWVIERGLTCEEAKSNPSRFKCGPKSSCSYFKNGDGLLRKPSL